MMTKFQCGYCLNGLKMPDKLVGRKILCPMCSEPIVIPEADPKRLFKKQDLGSAIDKFKLTDWDRAFARTIHNEKMLSDKDLLHAIAGTIKTCKKGPEISLGEYLYKEHLITNEQRKEIREKQEGNVGKEKVEFKECPNCFANVESTLRACKFCGQKFGAEASVEVCPGCKNEQPKGLGRCRRCMADMRTGLRPTSQRCRKCGELVLGQQDACPKCGADISKDKFSSRRKKKGISKGAIAGISIAALILIILAFTFGGRLFVSEEQASLERSIEKLCSGISDNAESSVIISLDPERNIEFSENLKSFIVSGDELRKAVKKIKEYTPLEITISPDKKTATVKMKLSVLLVNKSAVGDDIAINRLVIGESKEFETTWKWRNVNGKWVLVSPLP